MLHRSAGRLGGLLIARRSLFLGPDRLTEESTPALVPPTNYRRSLIIGAKRIDNCLFR